VITATALDRRRAALLFHALSDETRLAVIDLLRSGEQCVCELQDALDVAQSRLSFHLKVLKDAGLVVDRREGRWSYYTLQSAVLGEAHDTIRSLAPDESHRPSAPSAATLSRTLRVFGSCCS
jgi:ArsR family transcriptional regulator, arsenate/arsenite/antimonite-responsive transcriptional repressor